jgi:hypothetical protein
MLTPGRNGRGVMIYFVAKLGETFSRFGWLVLLRHFILQWHFFDIAPEFFSFD